MLDPSLYTHFQSLAHKIRSKSMLPSSPNLVKSYRPTAISYSSAYSGCYHGKSWASAQWILIMDPPKVSCVLKDRPLLLIHHFLALSIHCICINLMSVGEILILFIHRLFVLGKASIVIFPLYIIASVYLSICINRSASW